MAFYKSKYTGTEIDQRLTQGTYDDAVKAGFTGSKEEFDKIIVAFDENAQQKLDAAQPKIDHRLETLNKSIVDAINELHDEVSQKQDVGDYTDKEEFEDFKDEVAAIYATRNEVEESTDKINSDISTLNNNLVKSINTINENLNNSLAVINESTKQLSETLVAEIDQRKDADDEINSKLANLESKNILPGAGISIIEESPNKIINLADDTLTKIQYADSEVRRLEKDKIPYAYDEKTQSNINVILPEGGSYLGNYGGENATIAKAAVYDGTKQLEIGSSKIHTNINTDSDVTIETSDGKKVIATTDQIPDVFETKGLTELETGESSANIEAALGIDFASLIEIIRENKTVIVDRNSAGDYKTCIHASGNISSGNGGANLMFFIGTTPTIYQVQYVSGTFALAVDEYKFATKSDISNLATKDEIPDVSELATKEELVNKVDWIDYNNTKNIVLPSNGQVFGDFGGEESNSSLLGARIYNAGLENEEKQVEVGTSKVHLNLNSLDKPTIETSDGKENLVVESDIELMPKEIRIPIRSIKDKIYTQEEILGWFGVEDIVSLKKIIAYGGIQYVKYGLSLSTNPHYYKMPVEYVAFESANQIKLVFVGLNTRDDVASKYEIIMNLDGTIIEENSNVKMTVTSIEPGDIDLSIYATKEELNDYALKSELPDTSGFVTTEALDTKADKAELENVVKYTDISDADDTPRKTIMLDNNDTLSAYNTTGTANNIAMISKWDVVDLGSTSLPINLNGSKERPTYNDNKELALVSDIPNMSGYATTAELTSLRSELQQTETGVATANSEIEKLQSGKQSIQDETLQTTDKTVVGAINEILPKATGVGKVDPNSDGTGEIFNCYVDDDSFTANQATGRFAHAEGVNNVASDYYCHVEGVHNIASNPADHAEGQGCKAAGGSSHAEGLYCTTQNQGEHAEGKYNLSHYNFELEYLQTRHSVGIGGSDPDRKNAHEIMANGDHYVYGLGGYDGTNIEGAQTLQEVINSKQNNTDDTLQTTSKNIVGAINELLTKVQELETKNTELESRLAALEGNN